MHSSGKRFTTNVGVHNVTQQGSRPNTKLDLMPLCHFAFGSLHRAGNYYEQSEEFLSNILLPKRLRSFLCPEFMPLLNNPNGLTADPDSARVVEGGGITFDRWVPSPPVGLLPNDVWMISFVDIPLKKLPRWTPVEHYGKLGVVFTDKFRSRANVKRIVYYDEYTNLARDPMILQLHRAIEKQEKSEMERLRHLVVERRKPARLWPELNGLFAMLKISMGADAQATFEKITYSRYPEGYNFTIEQEARIVTPESDRDVYFEESEVLAVIAPDTATKELVEARLDGQWAVTPQVLVFPK